MKTDDGSYKKFYITEATISQIHHEIINGTLTCQQLVNAYIKRIYHYDQRSGINSIITINYNSMEIARQLDTEYKKTGKLRPLHGVPVIVKDNFNTCDMQTTAGSIALKGYIPPSNSFQIQKLREAGAVILAKSNMAEWAFSPYETISSVTGLTRNPYDTSRVPAGSSGGTAAAIAANLGSVGLGTDTGNSIRGPSSHCCLVGIRPTMGLTSRNGIIPLFTRNDMGGPMTRTVEDAARVLDCIAGYDPMDPITSVCIGKVPSTYTPFLNTDSLGGIGIGVFRHYLESTSDPQVMKLFEEAINEVELAGARIVDPLEIKDFEKLTQNIWRDTFRKDVNSYLGSMVSEFPFNSLEKIVKAGLYLPNNHERLTRNVSSSPPECGDLYTEPMNIALRNAVIHSMSSQGVDALIYPTWNNPPRIIGDYDSPAGDNNQKIPPHTGMPGFTIPMGFTYGHLPAGLQIVGDLFSEPTLFKIASIYEKNTKHRRPPQKFPELRDCLN